MIEEEFDSSAEGMDYEEVVRDRAAAMGSALFEGGPQALLDEIENLLPEAWREQVVRFPIAAILLGAGIGFLVGYKKGDDAIAAGSSMVAALATTSINSMLASKLGGHG